MIKLSKKGQIAVSKMILLVALFNWSITIAVTAFCLIPSSFLEVHKKDTSAPVQVIEEPVKEYLPEDSEEDTAVDSPEVDKEVPEHTTMFSLSDYDRHIVEQVIMEECGYEPYEGIVAVAQCIYNTAVNKNVSPAYVVQVPGQYASPSEKPANENVKRAVRQVFDLEEFYVEEPIMYFYAPKYSSGRWHESSPNLEYACTIGGHKFFKLRGT